MAEAEQTELFYRCDNLHQKPSDALGDLNSDGYIQECSLSDYAHESVNDNGIIDGLPEAFKSYFDYEAYARDLACNGEFTYDNSTYIATGF